MVSFPVQMQHFPKIVITRTQLDTIGDVDRLQIIHTEDEGNEL